MFPASRIAQRRQNPHRGGFSLVEILVVVAIGGILAALLLPAIQSSREASRKSQCANNLKQLGAAIHAYIIVNGTFPPGYVTKVLPDHDDWGPGWSWGALLTGFIEEKPLYDELTKLMKDGVSLRSPDAAIVTHESLPLFICPSDDTFEPLIDIPSKSSTRIICQMAAGSYVANAGTIRPTCKRCRDQFDGVFGRNRAIRPAEITDGLSKTFAIGERASFWSRPVIWGVVPNSKIIDNQQPGLYAAGPAYVLGTTFNEGFNIETNEDMDHGTEGTYAEGFGSRHMGGAHFLFCDGSVQYVWDDAEPDILNALSTRDSLPHSGEERIVHENPF